VEHHDFPTVPWARLPAVRRLAPEFYADLDWSPGLCHAVWRHARGGHAPVHYACT